MVRGKVAPLTSRPYRSMLSGELAELSLLEEPAVEAKSAYDGLGFACLARVGNAMRNMDELICLILGEPLGLQFGEGCLIYCRRLCLGGSPGVWGILSKCQFDNAFCRSGPPTRGGAAGLPRLR